MGPQFVAQALQADPAAAKACQDRKLRFLSNVDPVDFFQCTRDLDPSKTLAIVISKSFDETETVLNARTVQNWLVQHLAEVPLHVIPCIEERLPESVSNFAAASLYGSIFPAVWSFQLALRSRGLGSTLTTLHLSREREAAHMAVRASATARCVVRKEVVC